MPRFSEHEIVELYPNDDVNEHLDSWVNGITEAMDLGHSYHDMPNFIDMVYKCDRCDELHRGKTLLPDEVKGKIVYDAIFTQMGNYLASEGVIPIAVSWIRKRQDDERMRVAVSMQTADGREASAMVYVVEDGSTYFVEVAEKEYCGRDCNPVHSNFIESFFDSAMDVIEAKDSVDLTRMNN